MPSVEGSKASEKDVAYDPGPIATLLLKASADHRESEPECDLESELVHSEKAAGRVRLHSKQHAPAVGDERSMRRRGSSTKQVVCISKAELRELLVSLKEQRNQRSQLATELEAKSIMMEAMRDALEQCAALATELAPHALELRELLGGFRDAGLLV